MRTVDVRLLVASAHDVEQTIDQLLRNSLRIHGVTELVRTEGGLLVPSPIVHRHPRSTHMASVHHWDGCPLESTYPT